MLKRIICSILSIALVAGGATAQAADRVVNIVPSAEKGQVSHVSPYLTPKNAAVEATNVRINKQYGSVAARDILISEVDMGSGSVNGLHRFYTSAGLLYTVSAISTLLRYDAVGTATTIYSGLTDGKRWQFVTYKDLCIGSNGYDQPLKWDAITACTADTTGHRTAGDLCAELGAPFAALITGTTQTAAKWYQYKVCYYDGTTYRYSNARSNPILTGATVYSIALSKIPIGPAGTTHRYIYRSQANASRTNCLADTTYKMVKDLADNVTTTWTDNVAVGAEPDSPTWGTVSAGTNVTPPKGSILEICNERLFISGNTTAGYQSDVYWSENGKPDIFYPTKLVQIRPDDGDKVTFLKTFLGILTVGKTNTISRFYTENDDIDSSGNINWYVSNPFSFVGCAAPYTAAVTPKGIFYLSRAGIYTFTGQSEQKVSDAVTDVINDISPVNLPECVGCYCNNEYHLSYTSDSAGGSTNNRELVYDMTRDAYVVDTKSINCYAVFGSGTDYGTLFSGSSTSDGYVFAHSSTANTLNKRYKSELDAGTFSGTSTDGTETFPTLSMIALDSMESYTTNTLARATWTPSETTASMKVPPDLGVGTDGAVTLSADGSLSNGIYNYTSLTIDAGKTITAGKGTVIKCLGDVTINGYLYCPGALTIYAKTITVGAAGRIVGNLTLRTNTLTNNGLITGDMGLVGSWSFSAGGAGTGAGIAAMYDDDWATNAVSIQYADTTVLCSFPFTADIATVKYSTAGVHNPGGSGNVTHSIYLDGSVLASYSGSFTASSVSATGKNNSNSMTCAISCSSADNYGYFKEVQMYLGTPVIDFVNGATGTVRPTPAASDSTDFVYIIDIFSESTIKNQASYSLKAVVPEGADTLNENIMRTIADTDLSGHTYILMDVYALRSGTQMQLGLGEGSLTDFVNIPVATSNTWETVAIDISGIANANIDHTTRMGIKFTNTDSGNVIYIDNIRPAIASATWTSPVYQVNAATLKRLYWNENLNTYGDITWAIRTGGVVTPDGTWTGWTATEYTNPNGSDISASTANVYIQFKATLTTSDTTNYLYPWLFQADGFVLKMTYSKLGSNYETSVLNTWKTGWRDMDSPGHRKMIKRVIVYYEGEGENLSVNIKGDDNNVDQTFLIDMSILPDTDTKDRYTGTPRYKIYTWTPPINTTTTQSLVSDLFQFTITHEGDEDWRINNIKVICDDLPIY